MPLNKPYVISIHGMSTDGLWQEGAAAVLEPYFNYKTFKYVEFRKWAIPKLGAAVGAFFLVLLVSMLCRRYGVISYKHFVTLIICATLAYSCGYIYINYLFRRVISRLYQEVVEFCGDDESPHIIAHSLGTFMIGQALRKFGDLSCDTLILMGCVLRRKFPWDRMGTQYEYVSNEVAGLDLIPYVASLLSLSSFVKDMGCAGTRGFTGDVSEVHSVFAGPTNPNCGPSKCACADHCPLPSCSARVHNVRRGRFSHSDYFEGASHARRFWLPTLWGYDPVLYRQFLGACNKWDRLESNNGLRAECDKAFDKLRTRCWGWTQGTMEDFIRKQILTELGDTIEPNPDLLTAIIDVATSVLCKSVVLGAAESRKRYGRSIVLMEMLDPLTALRRATKSVLENSPLLNGDST